MSISNSKKWKQRLMLIQLFLSPFILSGCWSSVEIHDMAITNIMGIDLNDAGEFEVTAVIVKPSALFTPISNDKVMNRSHSKFLVETGTGKTIFDAMNQLTHSISEKIYLGHMDVVIFGEKAAKEKLQNSLDFFHRENQFRPNIKLLVAKGKAADVVKTAPEFNTTLGLEIKDFSKSNRNVATSLVKDISQFMKIFSRNTSDPVTGVLTTSEKLGISSEGEIQKQEQDQQSNNQVISLNGAAVFKDGTLKGFLNEKETRGILWLQGNVNNEVMILGCGKNTSGNISIIIRETNTQMIPFLKDNSLEMAVKTNVQADIGEVTCSNLTLNSKKIDQLNQQLAKQIKSEATNVLNKVQKQWQTDIFGFGEVIYRLEPLEWEQLAPSWRTGGLKELTVNVDVEANISRFGLKKNPSAANESR